MYILYINLYWGLLVLISCSRRIKTICSKFTRNCRQIKVKHKKFILPSHLNRSFTKNDIIINI